MALLDALRGVTQGVALASGNTDAANAIEGQEQRARAEQANRQQQALAPHVQAAKAAQMRVALYADPNDPTKPLPGHEQEYNAAHQQFANAVGSMRQIMHPAPAEQPGGIRYDMARLADRLHLTNDLAGHMREAQNERANQYYRQGQTEVRDDLAAIPPSEDQQQLARARQLGATPQQIDSLTNRMIDPEGTKAQDAANLAKVKVDGTADAKKRDDYEQFKQANPGYTGSYEQWVAQQGTQGRNAEKPLQYSAATGTIADPKTGKLYSAADRDLPPDVQKMFLSEGTVEQRKNAQQIRSAYARAAAYNQTRQVAALDSQNGNAPVYVSGSQIAANPGRYMPPGPAGKALNQENLFEDIRGTSRNLRDAINALPANEAFTEEAKAKIALAEKADDTGSALKQLIGSGALGSLTQAQQNVVIATQQMIENGFAMRQMLGAGSGSDSMRAAMTATLPSLLSPNRQYALKQLDAFDGTVYRLHRGVPNVKLNTTEGNDDPSRKSAPAQPQRPANAARVVIYNGKKYWSDAQGNNLGAVR